MTSKMKEIDLMEELRKKMSRLEKKEAKLDKARTKLEQLEERYRLLFEAGRDAVLIIRDGKFIECNSKTLEMFGCTRKQILGKPPHQFSPRFQPDGQLSREKAIMKIKTALTGKPQIFQWLHHQYDNTPFYAEVFLDKFSFDRKTYLQSIVRDISKRKHAEESLGVSESKYKILTEGLKDVVFKISLAGVLEYCSPVLMEFGGYNAEEEIGQSIVKFFARRIELSRALQLLTRSAYNHDTITFEFLFMPKNRRPFAVEVTSKPLIINKSVSSLICVMRDISQRREVEKEKQLMEERLKQYEKMEAIGRLAGGIAHDLNNILSAVVGYPDLLVTRLPANSSLRKPILTIKKSGQKAAAIVEDLMMLASRGIKNFKAVNLNDVIEKFKVSQEFEQLKLNHPNHQINFSLEENLNFIRGSEEQLFKIIVNLVTNASEAMPEAGKINISTLNLYPSQTAEDFGLEKFVVLIVTDTGIGIAAEDRHRIFEPFFTKKVMGGSGTGLGMAVVWGTVQDHRGYINFESKKGLGTTFELYFPVTRDAEQQPEEEKPLSINHHMGNGQLILIVDDGEELRDVAASMLIKLGYQVESVASGEAAVERFSNAGDENPFSLVILDMIMGSGMDGLDTYKALSQMNPSVKTLILSGFSQTERVREAQRLGAGEYLKKPCSIQRLAKAVTSALLVPN